jgi:hypothetical protein
MWEVVVDPVILNAPDLIEENSGLASLPLTGKMTNVELGGDVA